MNRFLIALVTVGLLGGWILSSTTRAVPPPPHTTTHVVLPVDQLIGSVFPPLTFIEGDLDATFEASPHAGSWIVRASFQPQGLVLVGGTNASVTGKATGSIELAPDAYGTVYATRLRLSGGSGRLFVQCAIVVDVDGVVSVQEYRLDYISSRGGGPGGDGGPCTDC